MPSQVTLTVTASLARPVKSGSNPSEHPARCDRLDAKDGRSPGLWVRAGRRLPGLPLWQLGGALYPWSRNSGSTGTEIPVGSKYSGVSRRIVLPPRLSRRRTSGCSRGDRSVGASDTSLELNELSDIQYPCGQQKNRYREEHEDARGSGNDGRQTVPQYRIDDARKCLGTRRT